jgi:hypothetical protein
VTAAAAAAAALSAFTEILPPPLRWKRNNMHYQGQGEKAQKSPPLNQSLKHLSHFVYHFPYTSLLFFPFVFADGQKVLFDPSRVLLAPSVAAGLLRGLYA